MSWIPGYEYTQKDSASPTHERFTTTDAIYRLFETFRTYDIKDSDRRKRILAIYNKNRPYNPEDLEKIGQKFRTNINFGALANAIDARAGAVSRIATETCNIISLESPIPQFAGPEDERASNVIAEEFSKWIRRDGRVIPAFAVMNKEADLYGCGPMTWRSPEDYVPQALRRGQVLFDSDGPVNSSDHEVIMVDTELEAATIFRMIENPQYAESQGWNIPALKRWAYKVFHNDFDSRSSTSGEGGVPVEEAFLEMLHKNDFYEMNQFRRFHVIFVYVREMEAPRKITHIIVPATSQPDGSDDKELRDILYKKKDAYDTMDDVFFWFCPDITKSYIRSARGIASDIAPKSAAKDRLSCAMVDGVIRSLSLVVKQNVQGASPIMSLQELGPYTVVGQEFDPVPNANQMSNFQGAMSVSQMLDSESVGSLAGLAFGPTIPKLTTGGTAPSKSEAEIYERRQTQRDQNYMMSRLATHRIAWSGIFRRFMKIAVGSTTVRREYPFVDEFVRCCEARGVTTKMMSEILKTHRVEVSREVMIGMDGVTQMISAALSNFGGSTDEAGRRRMAHDVVRYQLGSELANRYFPIQSRDNGASNDASVATLENNAMQSGLPVLMGTDQRQDVHVMVHMQVLQQIQETVQNGLAEAQREWQQEGRMQQDTEGKMAPKVDDPERLMSVLEAAMVHIREHLAVMSADKLAKDFVSQAQKTLTGMGDVKQALNLAIATQRRVREAEEKKRRLELEALQKQADQAEIDKANHKADIEGQNARHKIELDHQLALERLRMESETGRARLAMEGEVQRGKQQLDFASARHAAAIKEAEAQGEMQRKTLESQNNMRLTNQSAELDARIRAGEAAAASLQESRRSREVAGREVPQPADYNNPAVGGMIPL